MQERSRSPARPSAMPAPGPRHDGDPGDEQRQPGAGFPVPFPGVRCPNPKCGNKFAEELHGTLTITCRKCGQLSTITR